MKNKILLAIAIFLILFVMFVRYQFKEKFDIFKESILNYEKTQLVIFNIEKDKRIDSLLKKDKRIYELFTKQFDEAKAIITIDTSFSYLYLSKPLKVKAASLEYIDCLNTKCIIDKQNEINQKRIERIKTNLESKYGDAFTFWIKKFNDANHLNNIVKSAICTDFFPNLYTITFSASGWTEFENLLKSYSSKLKNTEIQNRKYESEYLSSVASAKSQFRNDVIDYFDEILSSRKSYVLNSEMKTYEFNSPVFGLITFDLNETGFNKQEFQNLVDQAFEEQWKNNSLGTGAMPYSDCYGSNNICDLGCSSIKVKTGGSDVLVTIKDINQHLIRHAYINSGYSYSFEVPDGQYQVFFYSGSGWNPNKVMYSTYCGSFYGGFVANENFTKDNYISLFSQIMTYELILQKNGNLSTKQSSIEEAF